MVLIDKPLTVESIKHEVSEGLLEQLKTLNINSLTEKQLEQLKYYYNHPDFTPQIIEKASNACKSVC
jgi:hypothetical protein